MTYPPGSLVLKILLDGHFTEEVYPARTYYEGRGDERGITCEKWHSAEADARARELGTACLGAFVPFPGSEPLPPTNLWGEVLALVRQLRVLIPHLM